MKKTLTVNLCGTVYHIDEDAFYLLDNYLANLRACFRRQQGGNEIVEDIESRIAELFTGSLGPGKLVITISDVESIITRIGKPEEMADGGKEKEDFSHTSGEKIRVEYSRRLYRNPDDKMLGGVLSGISAYFGWEASWVRLIFVLLVLCGVGAPILAYFICWIAIPLARTADQKLAMRGEQVTIENIGKTVKDDFEYVKTGTQEFVRSERTQQTYRKTTNTAADILGWILKAFLILAAVVFSPAILALLFTFFIVAVVMSVVLAGSGSMLYYMLPGINWNLVTVSPGIAIGTCIAVLLMVGIPLGSLLYVILQHIFNWEPMVGVTKWTLLILWIIGMVASIVIFLHGGWMSFWGMDTIRELSWMAL